MKKAAVLWSGGFDSTVMAYFLASENYSVKPYQVLIRNGSGKDAREKEAVDKVWNYLKNFYPGVEEPVMVKHKIKACDDRNEKMIRLLSEEYKEGVVALGSYIEGSRYMKDNDKDYLSKATGCEVITFDSFSIKNKQEIALLAKKLGLEDAVKLTWSCQLWFKNPCGKCFSCKNRQKVLENI